MNGILERMWVSILDSDEFRNLTRAGLGRRIMRSDAYRRMLMAKNSLEASIAIRRNPSRFEDVETFCLFVGHNKSGTSMLGSLLDAHPEIILADEVKALEYIAAGVGREQLFHQLLKTSRRELMKGRVTGRRLSPYSYLVPDQWQARFTRLRVIGDGAAGSTTRLFWERPGLIQRASSLMGDVDVKLIQVIRNPFDPISAMMVRGKRTFQNSIDHYFTSCQALLQIRRQVGADGLHAVRYEDFVLETETQLAELCSFLGVGHPEDYLQACAAIMRPQPDRSRRLVEWSPEWIAVVERNMARYEFLEGYGFES
jgi:hypothetical protein